MLNDPRTPKANYFRANRHSSPGKPLRPRGRSQNRHTN